MQDFVHLHVHSQYSVLDGQASIPKLVDKAIADGMRGMALTDHGNMMGCKEFFNYVSKVRGKGKDAVRKLEEKLQKLNAGDYEPDATEAGDASIKPSCGVALINETDRSVLIISSVS